MSDLVHELKAVLGRGKPAGSVASRDFKQPRRLSLERQRAMQLVLKNLLPALERKLSESTGLALGVTLADVGEVDADRLFAAAGEPVCVLRYRCEKDPSWLVWDPAAAVGVVEAILGARGAAPAARKLSLTEARVASQLLTEIVRCVAGALGIAVGDFVLVQALSELGSWRDAGAEAEPHRLEVSLNLQRGEQTSTLRVYLPGIEGQEPAPAALEALPAHLDAVEIELSARLAGCEISLDQLLALEEGDVIPLEARLGDPATLSIEGLTLGQARLGRHRGRLAVRIEQLTLQAETAA